MGLAHLEKGSTVMIPESCIRANSTIRSSFRWNGIGRLWLYTVLSSQGVNFSLNSVFIPISILCLAKISWYSTRISSIACFSNSVRSVSVQSNCLRNLFRDSMRSCGLSSSLSLSSFNSLRILVCIGVWSSGFPGFSGVGNQNVLSCCSVYSFWEVHLGRQSGQDRLVESYWGLPYLLVWCAWTAPE